MADDFYNFHYIRFIFKVQDFNIKRSMCYNGYEWILTYFATVIGPNVIVPIDKELQVENIRKLVLKCGAEVVVNSDIAETLVKNGILMNVHDTGSTYNKYGKPHLRNYAFFL